MDGWISRGELLRTERFVIETSKSFAVDVLWNRKEERRAATGFRLDPYPPAERLHDALTR